uniref:Uncharacterized protein n=1 Tax=viral metagenome TaxID=1070528 RepID=A0A6C0AC75_9ZZZZ
MNINTKEMFKTIAKVVAIYCAFHMFKVCFDNDDILNEEFLKNTLGISMAIVIYYIFLDRILEKF